MREHFFAGRVLVHMELTPEQKMSVARLYDNESLTDNLMDQDAKAMLEWAQEQIIANKDEALVKAAVRAANLSGQEGAHTLIAHANAFLDQEAAERAKSRARESETAALMTMGSSDASTRENDTTTPIRMSPTDSAGREKVVAAPATIRPNDSSVRDAMRALNAEKNSLAPIASTSPAKGIPAQKQRPKKRKKRK